VFRAPGPRGRRAQIVQTFGTTVAYLLALRDWLEAQGVTHVAMKSGQLLVHRDLDRVPYRRMDQLAERARPAFRRPRLRPGTLSHGASLKARAVSSPKMLGGGFPLGRNPWERLRPVTSATGSVGLISSPS
jgi:hypothetical protein